MLSVNDFEVVHSQIQHKTMTMNVPTQHFIDLFIFTNFIVFDVAFRKPISIDLLNASTFDTSFLTLATVNRTIHALYFSARRVYDDLAPTDLIISNSVTTVHAQSNQGHVQIIEGSYNQVFR